MAYIKKIIWGDNRGGNRIDLDWDKSLVKLGNNKHRLTIKEEDIINKIVDRL